jgi:uncharacterized membrane protein
VSGGLAYVTFLYVNYGIFSPSQLYGGTGQLFSANPIYNVTAILTDRSKGLFVHFPLLLIAGPFIFRMVLDLWKFTNKTKWNHKNLTQNHYLVFGLVAGLIFLLTTLIGFFDWSGSTAPNGRNMLPFILIFIFIVAKYFNPKNILESLLILPLLGLCAWLSFLSVTNFTTYMSTGVNSFWVDHFSPLQRLPLFGLSSIEYGRQPLLSGLKVGMLFVVVNVVLILILNYKLNIKMRTDLPPISHG